MSDSVQPHRRQPTRPAVPGVLQARTLDWVAISSSKAWKCKVKVNSLSHVLLLATPWTAAYQAPPSMGFSRQEYWCGLPLPSPGHRLGLLSYWMVCLETNRDHSVVFEIASKYYISDFVYHDGYSISSKGFLPTVVDIMVIWVKFTHASSF